MLLSTPGVYTLNVKSAGVLSGEATRPGLTLEKPVKQKQKVTTVMAVVEIWFLSTHLVT